MSTNTRPGNVIRHRKGTRYTVLHIGKLATDGKPVDVVVYLSMDDGQVWVRPKSEFKELVVWPDDVTRTRYVVDDHKESPP